MGEGGLGGGVVMREGGRRVVRVVGEGERWVEGVIGGEDGRGIRRGCRDGCGLQWCC